MHAGDNVAVEVAPMVATLKKLVLATSNRGKLAEKGCAELFAAQQAALCL